MSKLTLTITPMDSPEAWQKLLPTPFFLVLFLAHSRSHLRVRALHEEFVTFEDQLYLWMLDCRQGRAKEQLRGSIT